MIDWIPFYALYLIDKNRKRDTTNHREAVRNYTDKTIPQPIRIKSWEEFCKDNM